MIIKLVYTIFQIYYLLLFVRIILSWFPVNQYNEWVKIIHKLTDPYLDLFRKIIPPFGMIDFSPIVAFIALMFIQNVIIRILYATGIGLY